MIRRWFVTLVVIWALAGNWNKLPAWAEPDPSLVPLPLIDFRIKDQFDKLHTSGSFRHSVTVLISGDRKGSPFIGQWSPVLEDSLIAEVKSFRVKFIQHAHLKGVPFFLKGTIKDKFQQDAKVWVLMDWKGEFHKAFDLEEDNCSIVVFDRTGTRRIQEAVQDFDPEVFARILERIRELAE